MKKIIFLLIAVCSISTTIYAGTIKKISFETVDKGTYSPIGNEQDNKQRIVEIYNAQEWIKFWEWHKGSLKIDPAPKLPEINFDNFIIIIAVDQIRESGGYTLEIKEISIDTAFENRPFEISVTVTHPGSAAATAGVMSRPYHIIKLKK